MKRFSLATISFFVIYLLASGIQGAERIVDKAVISDGELSVNEDTLRYSFEKAPAQLKSQMMGSESARYEMIATLISSMRIRERMEALDPSAGDIYHAYYFAVMAAAKEVDEKFFQRDLDIPDLTELALERYRVSKSELALVPEQRELSHILLLCSEGCDEEEKRSDLNEIRERILAGESFSDLAMQYSEDPGSRQRGGRLSRPIEEADSNVDESFRSTAFALSEPGEISSIVKSRFGFHVMRLEVITEARELTFEEIEEPLKEEIESRYRQDAYRNHILSLGPSDSLSINEEMINDIMGALPPPQE